MANKKKTDTKKKAPAKKPAAKKTAPEEAATEALQTTQPRSQQAPLSIISQYIKDQSFENPHAPDTYKQSQTAPEIAVNINMEMKKIEEANLVYEVSLRISAEAKREGRHDFIAELTYGILAQVQQGVPEEHHHPLLLIECPKMAFPFVRQILATMTQQGGYAPLLLNPVDFEGLYRQQYAEMLKQQQAGAAQN